MVIFNTVKRKSGDRRNMGVLEASRTMLLIIIVKGVDLTLHFSYK